MLLGFSDSAIRDPTCRDLGPNGVLGIGPVSGMCLTILVALWPRLCLLNSSKLSLTGVKGFSQNTTDYGQEPCGMISLNVGVEEHFFPPSQMHCKKNVCSSLLRF